MDKFGQIEIESKEFNSECQITRDVDLEKIRVSEGVVANRCDTRTKIMLNFAGTQVPISTIMYDVDSPVLKPEKVDMSKIVVSDIVEMSAKEGAIKYARIFVGYKASDGKITSLCIKGPKQMTYGIQQYNNEADAKWKVTFIIDGANTKQATMIKCLNAIDAKVCDLIKNYNDSMIKFASSNPVVRQKDIPTFCRQTTRYEGGRTIRTITSAFFDKNGARLKPEQYRGKRLSMVPAIKYRDIYLSSGRIPIKTLEVRQAIITSVHNTPQQRLLMHIDADDFSDDDESDSGYDTIH